MTTTKQIIRIFLRYATAAAMYRGYIAAPEGAVLTDPNTLTALTSAIVMVGNEAWFWAAHRHA